MCERDVAYFDVTHLLCQMQSDMIPRGRIAVNSKISVGLLSKRSHHKIDVVCECADGRVGLGVRMLEPPCHLCKNSDVCCPYS